MKHIWIIDQKSSCPLFYHSYSKLPMDPMLASGLLMAFDKFSEVELQEGSGVSYIEMGGFRWVYQNYNDFNLSLIAAGDTDEKPEIMREQLDVISQMFIEQFQLTQEQLNKGINRIDIFYPFKKTLDDLQDQWNQASMNYESAIIFDLLGFFQQLLNEIHHIIGLFFHDGEKQKILEDLQIFWKGLGETFSINQNPEFRKMTFDGKDGWNIIEINPKILELDAIRENLILITKEVRNILINHLHEKYITVFTKELMPYILSQYDLLDKLKINKILINYFGVYEER